MERAPEDRREPPVRILVVSNLYPPVIRGGYETECAAVAERLRRHHDVTVLTSRLHRALAPGDECGVRRELTLLEDRFLHSLGAPGGAIEAARTMRRVLAEVDPDLVFIWNGAQLPQAALRIALDSGRPNAFRVCELWFGRLFAGDQFMRHLVPGEGSTLGRRQRRLIGVHVVDGRRHRPQGGAVLQVVGRERFLEPGLTGFLPRLPPHDALETRRIWIRPADA